MKPNSTKIHNLISQGFICAHSRINHNTAKQLESSSFLYALIELLEEKGILSIEELDEKKKLVAQRLIEKMQNDGFGILVQEPECDKYDFPHQADVNCESRLPICKAVCCKFPFALSRQDVEEGVVRWDFSRPYMIAHAQNGYCVHLDQEIFKCRVHENRPVPCRGFDCKDNEKWTVWKDYDQKALNTELIEKLKQGVY